MSTQKTKGKKKNDFHGTMFLPDGCVFFAWNKLCEYQISSYAHLHYLHTITDISMIYQRLFNIISSQLFKVLNIMEPNFYYLTQTNTIGMKKIQPLWSRVVYYHIHIQAYFNHCVHLIYNMSTHTSYAMTFADGNLIVIYYIIGQKWSLRNDMNSTEGTIVCIPLEIVKTIWQLLVADKSFVRHTRRCIHTTLIFVDLLSSWYDLT